MAIFGKSDLIDLSVGSQATGIIFQNKVNSGDATGTLQNIYIYCANNGSDTSARTIYAGLYSHDVGNNRPLNLLASGSATLAADAPFAWLQIPINTAYSIEADTIYWLAGQFGGSGTVGWYRNNSYGSVNIYSYGYYAEGFTNWPDPWVNSNDYKILLAFYGEVSEAVTEQIDIESDALIYIIDTVDINADAWIKTTDLNTIKSDACVKITDLDIIESDAWIKTTNLNTIESDACVKITDLNTIESDAYIKIIDLSTIESDAWIKTTDLNTIESDACVKITDLDTIESDALIYIIDTVDINADAWIKTTDLNTIESDATIWDREIINISSNALVVPLDPPTGYIQILSDTHIKGTETAVITSDAYIIPGIAPVQRVQSRVRQIHAVPHWDKRTNIEIF